MRTRTIEIPLCDLCNKDGRILWVTTPEGDKFSISRCEKHERRLRVQAGHEDVTEVEPLSREAKQLFAAIEKRPDEVPSYYAVKFGWSPQKVGRQARTLEDAGLVVREDGVYSLA